MYGFKQPSIDRLKYYFKVISSLQLSNEFTIEEATYKSS